MEQGELFDLSELRKTKEEYKVETKVCTGCKEELPNTFDFFPKNTKHSTGENYTKHLCKKCHNHNGKIVNELRKSPKTPPVSECCDNCGISFKNFPTVNIHLDHCKLTDSFRGWLCKNCNVGLGMLGDDEEGLKQALAYLERASNNGSRT
jgi:hypothetical protein